ncbi:STAS domain-containing protein [Spartinivicinus poritis]|uniref:STAS domain-containing protein n=1 Tax=Spartinivicinus poritis TaxID=2994640 RepID=A0ABT5UDM9_9GAMM|nr:STAS domain-containing protein [Spartinivicinus sp. A2-2]MDE1464453.1 STAS domain-containing protein [Spartinivicinus sp. A2-2]
MEAAGSNSGKVDVMTIMTTVTNDEVIIHLGKTFKSSDVAAFVEAYCKQSSSKQLIINLEKTEYISSCALGLFINLKNHFGRGPLRFINGSDFVKKLFSPTGLDERYFIEYAASA